METFRIFVNDRWVEPKTPYGSPALDFIRGELGFTGTKEGCREGDCGACAVLVGEFFDQSGEEAEEGGPGGSGSVSGAGGPVSRAPRYLAVPSCLLATGDLAGKHLVTIEGLGGSCPEGLTPVMRAFLEENASQCGFCSPGFVIALSAWLAAPGKPDLAGAMVAVDGNLCRCTGYGAIRRAASRLAEEFADLPEGREARLGALVGRGVLPESALRFMKEAGREAAAGRSSGKVPAADAVSLGGGTDYYVRNPDPAADFAPLLLRSCGELAGVTRVDVDGTRWIAAGAATSIHDFFASPLVRQAVPGIEAFEGQFASALIRNLATLGGNIANASPVGDITSMLMGLGARLRIGPRDGSAAARRIPLEDFFLGYKKTALAEGEIIQAALIPEEGHGAAPLLFSFEKIAKRRKLDIAAVNTALSFRIEEGFIRGARMSAGGVAPVPVLLRRAMALLEGARVDRGDPASLARLASAVAAAAEEEVRPIDDVRGSADYRKRMTGRLALAHFIRLFGADGIAKELFP